MGCSQGKAASAKQPTSQPALSAEPILLGAEEQQTQAIEKDTAAWNWKAESDRIFKLADKDGNGFIDMAELANVRNSNDYAEVMMGVVDENKDGKLSLEEWSAYVQGIFDKKEAACKGVLKLYEVQISQTKEIKLETSEWALQDEAIRIFNLADKDHSGFIDLAELANVRNSAEYAETMMGVLDENKDSKLSLAEWISYVKGVFDKKEDACKGLLKLYEKQVEHRTEMNLEAEVIVHEEKAADAVVVAEAPTDGMTQELPVISVQPQESTAQPPANLGFFSCCAVSTSA